MVNKKPKKRNILFVVSQHGSLNVIYPVLKACRAKYGIGYLGIKKIPEKGLIVNQDIHGRKEIDYSELEKFDIFITGSNTEEHERRIWQYAAERRKPSICVLDQHKNVEGRFVNKGRRVMPDVICAMNHEAEKALVDIGVKKEDIVVSGSPYIGRTSAHRTTSSDRRKLRQKMRLNDKKVITFCTEYIAKEGNRVRYGYDEHSVLDDIIDLLKRRSPRNFAFLIKVHPNDSPSIYERYAKKKTENIEFRVLRVAPGHKLIQISDVVIGMTSIMLKEAHMLGLDIISYQPSKDPKMIFLYDDVIRQNLARDKEALGRMLDESLAGRRRSSQEQTALFGNPVKKIMKVIEDKAKASGHA